MAAEIERLVASRFPEAFDYARLMEQAVGTMMTLSETGSAWTRLRAAKWLYDYASAHEALEAEPLRPFTTEQRGDTQGIEVETASTTFRELMLSEAEAPPTPLPRPIDQDPASRPVPSEAPEEAPRI
jgi:hypothetical protein